MNSTKGKWKVVEEPTGINQMPRIDIMAFDGYEKNVCQLSVRAPEEELANAHLIVAAVNACASVNPDNPMAVAKAIKELYEALKVAERWCQQRLSNNHIDMKTIQQALSKVEGK